MPARIHTHVFFSVVAPRTVYVRLDGADWIDALGALLSAVQILAVSSARLFSDVQGQTVHFVL